MVAKAREVHVAGLLSAEPIGGGDILYTFYRIRNGVRVPAPVSIIMPEAAIADARLKTTRASAIMAMGTQHESSAN